MHPRTRRPVPPATSAAPASSHGADPLVVRALAEELAVDIESHRRAVTLGGSLLFIPASAGAVLVLSALLGLPVLWLPVCALIGLSVGPALTLASLALANLVGGPRARRVHRRRALALGLPAAEIDETWRRAIDRVDARVKERIARGPRHNPTRLPEGSP